MTDEKMLGEMVRAWIQGDAFVEFMQSMMYGKRVQDLTKEELCFCLHGMMIEKESWKDSYFAARDRV